ncbi:KTSC domain-containing protein [Chroococcidiopsis sp. FACHB-1243]|uniref:KTSC domain-containing protein n=1 Tax=Chroococcidiopsis sp. [FACHB-1243] TaxID=2692781 RepID=UPI001784CDFB|nr:KTSC domain-containing protein [Chroococcidiopsis sp. [FACHB-1243]]MBD2305565.1 KTSC domain-containing protein [Chroococcidiopsis sp. [FACHB-1243]]
MKDTSILLEPRSSSRKLVRTKKSPDRPIEFAKTNYRRVVELNEKWNPCRVKTTKLRDWLLEPDFFLSQNLQFVASKKILDSIEMLPVIECEVVAIGYCDLLNTLQVDYRNGTRYHYYDVAPARFDLLIQATDLKCFIDFFHQLIATYKHERVR